MWPVELRLCVRPSHRRACSRAWSGEGGTEVGSAVVGAAAGTHTLRPVQDTQSSDLGIMHTVQKDRSSWSWKAVTWSLK